MRSLALAASILVAAVAVQAAPPMCNWKGVAVNLGGETIKTTSTDTVEACCAFCSETDGCFGYNWCSGPECDGGYTRGTCHAKKWESSFNFAEAYGCSGEGQHWRSGFMSSMLRWKDIPPPCPPPGAPAPAIAGVPGGARTNYVAGPDTGLVVLDVDSWKMGEGGNHGSPYVRSAYGCATSCHGRSNRAGLTANAFTYCDAPEGCGAGCAAFSRGNAPMDGARDDLYFGPFGGKGCAKGADGSPTDKFAYQLCTCKRVDLGNPLLNDEPGWVSGPAVEPVKLA